ncbi:Fur family transcriptional regulator [Haloplasma contractile]|uniref:Ferric uptake regulation protein n=1 Tax=Haloplasma contractile SSD-17B TaxID=1033810 RepID=U2EFQ7_9MOLU|nr:transcriptional repressor [Haloplasma contractile]ERJ13763.1 Ferric uptake regulation protein [Haloplasma contractile SSD-17B]
MANLDDYIKILKEHKAKVTPQRKEILQIFLNDLEHHFTADEICKALSGSSTGQATVYRTLELFIKIGILKKVNFHNEEFARYDLIDVKKKHFHHHIVCAKCNKVIEVREDLLEDLEKTIEEKYGFKIVDHELLLRGECVRCKDCGKGIPCSECEHYNEDEMDE